MIKKDFVVEINDFNVIVQTYNNVMSDYYGVENAKIKDYFFISEEQQIQFKRLIEESFGEFLHKCYENFEFKDIPSVKSFKDEILLKNFVKIEKNFRNCVKIKPI